MPTIEFFGYDQQGRDRLEDRVRERLAGEDFREECVFVTAAPAAVRDWHGAERPFVRVSTRSPVRAARFRAVLHDLCDLETVQIGFQPRATADEEGS